jgi:hypothetical protein
MGPSSVVVSSRERAKGLQIHLGLISIVPVLHLDVCKNPKAALTINQGLYISSLLLFDFESVRVKQLLCVKLFQSSVLITC